jgi:type IV secretion system protein VirB11
MRWETIPSGSAPPPDDHRPPGDARSSLDLCMAPLRGLLVDDRVTEICINRPHEAYVQRPAGWSREELAFASFQWCLLLAKLVASVTRQRLSPAEPLLAATLADGARIQIVVPPATEEGTVSITIRRPSRIQWTLEQLRERGTFAQVRVVPTPAPDALAASSRGDACAQELTSLLLIGDFVSFLRHAVRSRKNILLSGVNGSGKTTLAKALLMEVPPEDRLVTIEDVRELSLRNLPNHVRMFCGSAIPGAPPVTAAQLLATARRQGADRVFLSELRGGEEVCDYLSLNNGHPGSIACVQAGRAELAFVALAQLMKRSDGGRGMTTREGVELAQSSIDVVVQCSRSRQHRGVSEIWYDPGAKRRSWM